MNVSKYHSRAALLIKQAFEKSDGPLTIAVGDGANEIGA